MARYLNSAEPMCDGSDTTVLFADDFEDGNWFETNEDPDDPDNDGWLSVPGVAPADAVAGGACGTSFAASTGVHINESNKSAWHRFGNSTWTADGTYEEIYHRFYLKFQSGYDFGHEKIMAYHHDENIEGQIGFFHNPYGESKFQFFHVQEDQWLDQNQGNNLNWTIGNWHYCELRILLNTNTSTANGVVQMWGDDVGADGLGDPGAGTLRLSHSGLLLRRTNLLKLGAIFHEFWLPSDPPEYTGGGTALFDQVIVRTQRIGPMGAVEPGAPTKLAMSWL